MVYKDSKGIVYKVGDIVYNPCIGDFWVVQTCEKEEKELYGIETDICLALNNCKDDYVIDIDEPVGFEIVIRENDENYDDAISELNHIAEMRCKYNGETKSIEEN